jgi:hypothetical protein
LAGKFDGRLAGRDPGPIEADIDFEQEADVRAGGRLRQGGDLIAMVDANHGTPLRAEFDQPSQLCRPDDLIGNQDVVDSGMAHHFGFAKLGAGDADGPCAALKRGDVGRFMSFGMGTPVDAMLSADCDYSLDVAVERRAIDAQGRGIELVDGAADQRMGSGVAHHLAI